MPFKGIPEQHPGIFDMLSYFRQIGQLQRRTVLVDDIHQRYIVEQQLVILHVELHRGEFKGLLNQINVTFHWLYKSKNDEKNTFKKYH